MGISTCLTGLWQARHCHLLPRTGPWKLPWCGGRERPLLTLLGDPSGVLSDPGWSFLAFRSNTPGYGWGGHLWVSAEDVWARQVVLCPPVAAPRALLGSWFPLRCGYRLRNDRVRVQWHVLCVRCCPCHWWQGLGGECVSGALPIPLPSHNPCSDKGRNLGTERSHGPLEGHF